MGEAKRARLVARTRGLSILFSRFVTDCFT